jgi:hypothetical protein
MRFPRFALAVLVGTLSCLLGLTAPARAGGLDSVTANPGNAWVISELGAEVGSVPASSEVSAYAAQVAAGATVGTGEVAGVTASAGSTGAPWGMILNSVAVLGGLSLLWHGGSDAPGIPAVVSGSSYVNSCPNGAGWATAGTSVGCSDTVVTANYAAGGSSSGDRWFKNDGAGWSETNSSTHSIAINYSQIPVGTVREYQYFTGSSGVYGSGTRLASVKINYRPQAIANPTTTADPATTPHTITSTAQCIDSGGVTHTITNTTSSFTFSPASTSFAFPQVPDLACPAGQWLSSGERHLDTAGVTQTVPLVQPYTAPEWVGHQATQFPECFPIGSTQCQLELFQLSTVKHAEYGCHSFPIGAENPCLGWWTDPDRKAKYECRFGSNVVALKRCTPYKTAFANGQVVATPADPDTDLPEVVVGTDPTPEQTPGDTGCVPNWSEVLSPWWVYKGAVCALKWAFVPETSLSTRMQRVQVQIKGKVPFTWFSGFTSIPAAVPAGSCPDWTVKVNGTTKNVVCDSSYTAAIRTARPVLAVFMGALALWPLIRSTAYAAFPIIKPQPGVLR